MKEQLLVGQDIDLFEEIAIKECRLIYRDIDLLNLSKKHGTPLRFTYLPAITEKINEMKLYFREAIERFDYRGKYFYFYCTKSSHFKHVIETAIKSDIGIEISSDYDVELVKSLIDKQAIPLCFKVICNGYKTSGYLRGIRSLIEQNYCAVLPIIDSKNELIHYGGLNINFTIGVRLNLSFLDSYKNESRFGLSPKDIIELCENEIRNKTNLTLTTLHFFYEKGISDSLAYWDVLEEVVRFYCQLKRLNPKLTTLDIGGGMSFRNRMEYENNISELVCRIISTIQRICQEKCIPEPDIITEFGKYTVAEATATIFKIQEKKGRR